MRATDGHVLWQWQAPRAQQAQADITIGGAALVADGIIYVGAGERLYALRATDGTVLWSTAGRDGEPTDDRILVGTPTLWHATLFIPLLEVPNLGGYFGGSIFAVAPDDGQIVWRTDALHGEVWNPLVIGT